MGHFYFPSISGIFLLPLCFNFRKIWFLLYKSFTLQSWRESYWHLNLSITSMLSYSDTSIHLIFFRNTSHADCAKQQRDATRMEVVQTNNRCLNKIKKKTTQQPIIAVHRSTSAKRSLEGRLTLTITMVLTHRWYLSHQMSKCLSFPPHYKVKTQASHWIPQFDYTDQEQAPIERYWPAKLLPVTTQRELWAVEGRSAERDAFACNEQNLELCCPF